MAAIDQTVLGERLRLARSNANLTQDAAATSLGVARTTLVAIERGQRRVRPEELVAFAALYGVTVGKLTAEDAIHVDLSAKFRRAEGKEASKGAQEALHLINRLATGAVELEQVLGQPLRTDYPPPIRIMPNQLVQQAEDAAVALRQRLGVGLGPISDISALFEIDMGVRLFYRPLPRDIAGLYAYDAAIGACILVNASHPRRRRVQTVAHEGGHFASDRSHADILDEEPVVLSVEERFARRFGPAFLMPASTMRTRVEQISGTSGRFATRELVLLAHQFGVATEAMARRLEELDLLPQGTWESLAERGFSSKNEQAVLGEAQPDEKPPLIPARLAYLAATALEDGLLSEGQLCELLVVDRIELREAVEPFQMAASFG